MSWLVVGLGNPGAAYEWTRHSIGMLVARHLMQHYGLQSIYRRDVLSYVASRHDGSLYIAYTATYMNESGRAVGPLMRSLSVSADHMVLLVDDIETAWGNVSWVAPGGGTRGHNGVRSVYAVLGADRCCLVRIGVGYPSCGAVADYVLGPFSAEEQKGIPDVCAQVGLLIERECVEKR